MCIRDSTQSVVAGSYKAVEYIKGNIQLDENADLKASTEKSKEVVKICTRYAQHEMCIRDSYYGGELR